MAKKRTNGEGTIRQRDNGRWECTVMDGFQSDGRRKYRTFYGKTEKAASIFAGKEKRMPCSDGFRILRMG